MNESGKPADSPSASADVTDREWIQDAIDQHEGALVRYAQQFVGDLDRARDVVQDTFMQLLKCDRSAVQSHLRPWLFRVCRNRAIDVSRKERRMKPTDSQTLDRQINQADSPATAAEHQDTSRHIQSLIGDLDKRQQELLRLKFQNAMSYQEIATVTGLTVSNVGFILHTAIQKIRKRANAGLGIEST